MCGYVGKAKRWAWAHSCGGMAENGEVVHPALFRSDRVTLQLSNRLETILHGHLQTIDCATRKAS